MKSLLIEDALILPEDTEARREHERYECQNITAYYSHINPAGDIIQAVSQANIKDISLKGLAIETCQAVKTGDILSIEICPSDTQPKEIITAVIMWCETGNQSYNAGLRIVSADTLNREPANDNYPKESEQDQIICPSCNETSFFLREINSDQQTPDLYHCCHCSHSHEITEVMAFNRRFTGTFSSAS